MHDFGEIVYLDMHKTGSTVTSRFLRECCLLKDRGLEKHQVFRGEYRPDTFYFTTVRNPFDLYVSLFRYGCDKRGGVYRRFKTAGLEGLYQHGAEGFGNWLAAMLDPGNATLLDPRYPAAERLGLGFMSFRHMLYSLHAPVKKIRACRSLDALNKLYRNESILGLVIRNEALAEGLAELALQRFPGKFDPSASRAFLSGMPQVNVSRAAAPQHWPEEMRGRIADKEALLFDHYYPQDARLTGVSR